MAVRTATEEAQRVRRLAYALHGDVYTDGEAFHHPALWQELLAHTPREMTLPLLTQVAATATAGPAHLAADAQTLCTTLAAEAPPAWWAQFGPDDLAQLLALPSAALRQAAATVGVAQHEAPPAPAPRPAPTR